jgi:hypothetical protein
VAQSKHAHAQWPIISSSNGVGIDLSVIISYNCKDKASMRMRNGQIYLAAMVPEICQQSFPTTLMTLQATAQWSRLPGRNGVCRGFPVAASRQLTSLGHQQVNTRMRNS